MACADEDEGAAVKGKADEECAKGSAEPAVFLLEGHQRAPAAVPA